MNQVFDAAGLFKYGNLLSFTQAISFSATSFVDYNYTVNYVF